MKCNNVMSNCAKVIKDTMRSYAKKQHAIWPGITRDNSGENPWKTQGKLLAAAAIMAAVSGRGSGSGAGGATKVVNDSSSSSSNLNKGQRGGRQRTGAWRVGVRATWPQKVEAQLTRCCRVTSATVASGFSCCQS